MLVYRSLRHGRHQTELKLRANGLHTKVEIAGSAGSTPWGSAPTGTVHPRVGHGTSCTQSKDTRTCDVQNFEKNGHSCIQYAHVPGQCCDAIHNGHRRVDIRGATISTAQQRLCVGVCHRKTNCTQKRRARPVSQRRTSGRIPLMRCCTQPTDVHWNKKIKAVPIFMTNCAQHLHAG